MKGNQILVVIPCYQCAIQLPRVLAGFDQALLNQVDFIALIDNRSKDSTVQAALETITAMDSSKISLLQNDENYGLGGTHKVAFQLAERLSAEYVAILHGDNQATTEELKVLIEAMELNPGIAAVLGSRFMSKSRTSGYSPLRLWGNRGLNFFYSLLSGRATWDLGSGLNLFKVSDLPRPDYLAFSDGFTFNMDLLLSYYRRKKRLLFVPISWGETDQRSNASTFKVGWIALKTILAWRFTGAIPRSGVKGRYRSRILKGNLATGSESATTAAVSFDGAE